MRTRPSEVVFTAFRGAYARDADGTWFYRWGDEVPGARDVHLSDVLPLLGPTTLRRADIHALRDVDLALLTARYGVDEPLRTRRPDGRADAIVGMSAPEVEAANMMTVACLADAASVSKATIDSYRYRGLLPEPQTVISRTPLWSPVIIARWLEERDQAPHEGEVQLLRDDPA